MKSLTSLMLRLPSTLLFASLLLGLTTSQKFNFEVEKRVFDRLDFYLFDPSSSTSVIKNFRTNHGFEDRLRVSDREKYLQLAFSVLQPRPFYTMEDGSFAGYHVATGFYREPGNAGYALDDPVMSKHLNTCVKANNGTNYPCTLKPGDFYTKCKFGEERPGLCAGLELCPGHTDIWCRPYELVEVQEGDEPLGGLPLTATCIDTFGRFTDQGLVYDREKLTRVDSPEFLTQCTYNNGEPVQRTVGAFEYCGGDGAVCDDAFLGVHNGFEYDGRYRDWYQLGRKELKPLWSLPYIYVPGLEMGITYVEPVFDVDDQNRTIFAGNLAVDILLEDITTFLLESYSNSDTLVFIYEEGDPHYMIASSTGSKPARLVLQSDLETPCPAGVDVSDNLCTSIRRTVDEPDNPADRVLSAAVRAHEKAGYTAELVAVKSDENDAIFVTQSSLYNKQSGVSWRILVISPGLQSQTDAITSEAGSLIWVVAAVGTSGFLCCSWFFVYLYKQRSERAIAFSDWRFTCAFVLGCAMLNISTLTLIGENTQASCLARMWVFNVSFALALSPLLVKIWRIWKLVGIPTEGSFRRRSITNRKALLYTTPFICTQVLILIIFTFADPPKPTETLENVDGTVTQHITCDTETSWLFVVQLFYAGAIVLAGCVLAYKTRNLADEFGEAKQLIIAMYNIALVGIIIVLVTRLAELDMSVVFIFRAVGIFWGTIFSTAVFVIPRMLQVRQQHKHTGQRGTSFKVHVTGVEGPITRSSLGAERTTASAPYQGTPGNISPESQASSTDKI